MHESKSTHTSIMAISKALLLYLKKEKLAEKGVYFNKEQSMNYIIWFLTSSTTTQT